MLTADCCMACGTYCCIGGFLLLSACHHSERDLVSAQGTAEYLLASCQMLFSALSLETGKVKNFCAFWTGELISCQQLMMCITCLAQSSLEEQGKLFNVKLTRGKKVSQILQVSVLLLALSVHSYKHLFFRRATVV